MDKAKLIRLFAVFFSIVLLCSDAYAKRESAEIFISETVVLKTGITVHGELEKNKTLLEFEGKIKKQGRSVNIKWHKVIGKKLKPSFTSRFKTDEKTLREGTRVKIYGDFAKLIKKIEEIKEEESQVSSGEGETELADSNLGTDYNNTSSSSATTGATPSAATTATPTNTDSTSTPQVSFETCESKIDGSTIHIQRRSVSTYSDGNVEYGSCETEKSYSLITSSEGCGIKHNYDNKISYQQEKIFYHDDQGSEITIRSCSNSSVTYAHFQMKSDCEEFFDSGTGQAYQMKKTYIKNRSGNIEFISQCKIDANDIKQYTEADYLRDYSDTDRIDRVNRVAYRRYKLYLPINGTKVYVSDFKDDLSSGMNITKDYQKCNFQNDVDGKISYKQYADVYYKDGQRLVVSECMPDHNKSFAHITDDKYCDPKIINKKLYKMIGTYFTDDTGTKVQVMECSLTDYELLIDNQDVGKNFKVCEPRIDLDNNRAIAFYKEEITIGEKSDFLSACIEDPDKYYPILETVSGCKNKVDVEKQMAYQQKRKYYNDGIDNHFVTQCEPTTNRFEFDRSTVDCPQKLSPDRKSFIESEEVFYRDFNGQKRIVESCSPTGLQIPIQPDDIFKDYEVCQLSLKLDDKKVYFQFKEYVNLNGQKKYSSECIEDPVKFFTISEKTEGCDYRMDYINEKAILQHRKFYNNGYEDVSVTECYDSPQTFNFIKSADACEQQLNSTGTKIVEYKEIYYIDNNGIKKKVRECSPTGIEYAIAESEFIRNYENCDHWADYANDKVYKQYETYVRLNGKEKLITGCVPDFEAPTWAIKKDYDQCEAKLDTVENEAILTARLYYVSGQADSFLTDCVETDIKYPILVDDTTCPKLPVPESNELIFQKKLYYVDGNSSLVTVKDCYPTNESGVIEERACDPEWIHDMIGNVTYYNTKFAYDNNEGEEVIVKPCQYSLSKPVYSHKVDLCGYQHDDENKKSYVKKEVYFLDENGVRNVVTECANDGVPVSYAYNNTTWGGWINGTKWGTTHSPCNSNIYYLFDPDNGSYQAFSQGKYREEKMNYIRADNSEYNQLLSTECKHALYCSKSSWGNGNRYCRSCSGYYSSNVLCGWH